VRVIGGLIDAAGCPRFFLNFQRRFQRREPVWSATDDEEATLLGVLLRQLLDGIFLLPQKPFQDFGRRSDLLVHLRHQRQVEFRPLTDGNRQQVKQHQPSRDDADVGTCFLPCRERHCFIGEGFQWAFFRVGDGKDGQLPFVASAPHRFQHLKTSARRRLSDDHRFAMAWLPIVAKLPCLHAFRR